MQSAQSNTIYGREEVVVRKTEVFSYPYGKNQQFALFISIYFNNLTLHV